MLLLGSNKTITVDGVTVFPDHSDANQFWYLPSEVTLARRSADDRASFTFIKFKPAVVAAGVKGGGFLTFEANARLSSQTERKVLSRLSSIAKQPKLTAVQFDEGTVQCVALNLQGAGGTTAEPAPAGTFRAVEKILGASVPSLYGNNSAAFSLTLDQEGAIILEKAFKDGTTPVGVLYNLKFTGLRPALQVEITADFKRIYNSFSASLSGQYYFFKATLEAAFEKLKQDGAIKINVINFSTAAEKNDKEKWALDFFKESLLKDWFEPTLSPGQIAGGSASGLGLPGLPIPTTGGTGTSTSGGTGANGGTGTSSGGTGASSGGAGASTGGTGASSGGTGAATGAAPAKASVSEAAGTTQPVSWDATSTPNPLPAGYEVRHAPTDSGNTETITVLGGENPTVRVNGAPRALNPNRQFTLDVAPGQEFLIDVEYPSVKEATETFNLLYDFDKPAANNFNVTKSTYVNGTPKPPDSQFSNSTAPSGNTTAKGAAALREWIRSRVTGSPKQLQVKASASFEGNKTQPMRNHNLDLSRRRLDVAVAIIQSIPEANVQQVAVGQAEAEASGRTNRPEDRVAKITGIIGAGNPPATVHAKISRPTATTPSQPSQPGQPTNPGTPTTPGQPATPAQPATQPQSAPPAGQQGTPGDPAIALKLKFVHQEELKTLSFTYNSSEAVQRTFAPQGFFGLLLADLEKSKYFIEVDLDDPFFRVFTVTVDAPFDFDKIGLNSAHVALDYGKPSDPENKHADFIFDAHTKEQKKLEVFMNSRRETSYTTQTQFHFSPDSGWEGEKFSYELPAKNTQDRTQLINPYEDLGFLEVKVFPNRIDTGVINSTDVQLEYRDAKGWTQKKTITVLPTSEPQFWRLRLSDPASRSFTYRFTHHLRDGTIKTTNPVTSQASAVAVDDPFEGALDLVFIPALNPTRTRKVFIDVNYQDEKNNYKREERLEMKSDAVDDMKLRISLVNPKLRTFHYRFTFVGSTGQITRSPLIESLETLIAVTEGQ